MSALSQAHAKFKKFRYDLKNEKSTADKMSTREKLSINLVNSGGDNCMNTLKSSFFNVFLTTSLGLDPTTIALLATVTTILGYIKDPITALIIESTRTKWGRFKPYVVICMPAVVLLNFAFMMNPFSDYQAKVIYVFTLEILLSILSGFAGAWGNMKRCLSRDKKERENYYKMAKVFRDITGCIPGIIPVLIDICKASGISNRYVFMGMAIILFPFSFYSALQARHLRERVFLPPKASNFLSPKELAYNIKMVAKNKNAIILWWVNVGTIFNYVADIANAYVFMYCYQWYSLQTVMGVCGGIVSWICIICSKKIFGKIGYKGVAIGYKILMASSMIVLYCIGFGTQWYFWIGVCLCRMVGASLEQLDGVATDLFQTDVWDHYEWKTGVRNETVTGLISGYVLMPISLLKPIFYAYVFNKIGFRPGENVVQPASALQGLFFVYTIFIALGSISDIFPYLLVRLNKKTMETVRADLKAREAAKEAARQEGRELTTEEILSIHAQPVEEQTSQAA